MNDLERKSATMTSFMIMDPEKLGGLLLRDVAEQVAQRDAGFMRRYNVGTKIIGLFGAHRQPGDLGLSYVPRMYPVVAGLERQGIVTSEWEDGPEGAEEIGIPRRRLYRFAGLPEVPGLKS